MAKAKTDPNFAANCQAAIEKADPLCGWKGMLTNSEGEEIFSGQGSDPLELMKLIEKKADQYTEENK